MVAADTAGGDDHGLCAQRELARRGPGTGPATLDVRRLEHRATHPVDDPAGAQQLVHPVPEAEPHQPAVGRLGDPALERRDHARPGAPGQVEPRYRVAVPVGPAVASLGPADHREQPVSHRPQPGPLLAGGELRVRLRPAARPVVLVTIEPRTALPVLPGQVERVPDTHPALLGGVHHEQPAERPERLAAETLLRLLVEQQDLPAGVGKLGGRDQAGQPGPDDDDVSIHGPDPIHQAS